MCTSMVYVPTQHIYVLTPLVSYTYRLTFETLFVPGDGRFGDKSVNDVAVEYVEASRQNLHKFQPPRVIFVFCDGITESISCELGKSLVMVNSVTLQKI